MLPLGMAACAMGAEKPPVPNARLPYASLGFPGYSPTLMRAPSYSMATVHLLDSTHLLLTFTLRTLVPRVAGDDENDSDRLVAAEVVDIANGKVLAHTQWRLHDHSRYLWRAGDGLFVLRSADELSTFAPLRGLASGEAFQRVALPHRPGIPQYIGSSPDGAILTVEVQRPEDKDPNDDGSDTPKTRHTTIQFFRVSAPAQPDSPIELSAAGPVVGAPSLLRLVLDGDGYLWAEDQGRSNWLVSFNEYAGKQQKLTSIHSSCPPRLSLLSRSEFLAETCRGVDDSPMLAAYGFDGHENWEEPFGGNLQPPTIATAPQAGRFAMSRLVANGEGAAVSGLSPEDPLVQEIRVYQTESGDMLLHLQCSNPIRTAENFDISPDGSTLAVMGHDGIEIYKLRGLTERDRKDLADVQTMTPPLSTGPVELSRILQPVGSERRLLKTSETASGPGGSAEANAGMGSSGASGVPAGVTSGVASAPAAEVAKAAGSGAAVAAAASIAGADPAKGSGSVSGSTTAAGANQSASASAPEAVAAPRKPPTLLAPGESPEFKGAGSRPQ